MGRRSYEGADRATEREAQPSEGAWRGARQVSRRGTSLRHDAVAAGRAMAEVILLLRSAANGLARRHPARCNRRSQDRRCRAGDLLVPASRFKDVPRDLRRLHSERVDHRAERVMQDSLLKQVLVED